MPQSLNLTIPIPCHEDWSAMQPDEKGGHCAACKKTVVDFTGMSDAEVVAYMSRAGSNLCGRFAPDQLGRKLAEAVPPKRSRWPGWQLLLTGALLTADGSQRPAGHVKGLIVERVEETPTAGFVVPKITDSLMETKIKIVECAGEVMGEVPGTYEASLYTLGGTLMQQRVIAVGGPGQIDEWPLPATAAAGVYILRIKGGKNLYAQKVVVQ